MYEINVISTMISIQELYFRISYYFAATPKVLYKEVHNKNNL